MASCTNARSEPIVLAAELGDFDKLVDELQKKPPQEALDIALFVSSEKNFVWLLQRLVAAGANVDTIQNGETSIVAAYNKKYALVVRLLVDFGARAREGDDAKGIVEMAKNAFMSTYLNTYRSTYATLDVPFSTTFVAMKFTDCAYKLEPQTTSLFPLTGPPPVTAQLKRTYAYQEDMKAALKAISTREDATFEVVQVRDQGLDGVVLICKHHSEATQEVWRRHHGDTKEEFLVAVKPCIPVSSRTDASRQRLLMESSMIKFVPPHPNISVLWSEYIVDTPDEVVRLHTVDPEIAFEYFFRRNSMTGVVSKLKGLCMLTEWHPETLGQHVQRLRDEGTFTLSRALNLARQLGDALLHMWECGYVHMDVSLEHIVVASDGRVVLTDLGCALKLSVHSNVPPRGADIRYSSHDTPGGNAEHLAPEFLDCRLHRSGYPNVSGQPSWELGCILLEMVLERYPFPTYAKSAEPDELSEEEVRGACLKLNKDGAIEAGQVSTVAKLICSLVHPELDSRRTIRSAVLALQQWAPPPKGEDDGGAE